MEEEVEGTYRLLQTPGARLGAQTIPGVSTLEPQQSLSSALAVASPKLRGRRIQLTLRLLDNTEEQFEVEQKAYGESLMNEVFLRLNLTESDYFGLEFQNSLGNECSLPFFFTGPKNTILRLSVKFFPPDPGQLQEEYTRYLFALQIKRDLAESRLMCNENTAALLTSHLLQSEIGDYDEALDRAHLKENTLLPNQEKLQEKIMEFHRKHMGHTPAESDFQVLEIARKLEMYGIRFHPASDREGTKINLSVAHMGVLVFQGNVKINTFNWSKIRKLSFKRKRFLIKLHPEVHGPYQDTLEFLLGDRDLCKIFWKNCVEYHTFFRLMDQPKAKAKPVFLSRGSSFRYSGRTQKQLVDYMRESVVKATPYQRYVLFCIWKADFIVVLQFRYPADKAYFIAKEILTTERTYLKDLEVITVWFRSAVIKEKAMPEGLMTLLFSNIDPIYEYHRGFLKEIEQRLALWEGRSNAHVKGDYQRIGDVMLRNMCVLKEFTSYLQKHDEVLTELEKATKRSKKLEAVYKEFELQKVCYLPLNTFLLKPIQRLMHYKLILERLCRHYPPDHQDYGDCQEALMEVGEVVAQLQSSLIRLENFQKLTELQRDLIGIENLILPGREFIREGCLYKLTKKGLQQRMFFLFSDMLLYTSKGVTITNQFKVHGELPLYGMIVEESENEWSVPHCFTIYSAQKTIVVAASSRIEMGKWIEDLNMAIDLVKKSNEKGDAFLETNICDRSNRSSDEVSVEQESEDDTHSSRSSLDKQTHHRANTTMHVCWHRNTSVSMMDHSVAVENQLSGYLLRKFKNSNGWQKLWVVFTNFCLFFYKTHQDDYPLASLPLLGYTASMPSVSDSIHKDYVFKLQFKTHVYFFRAESEYTFESSAARWSSVITDLCFDLLNFITENVSLHMYIDTNSTRILWA
uniref:FERM, ARHGEF and pleckstrin domain-containing protein 2 n=1 Tax=Callorhinchus milii TaxID=7868 RepID=A0A4W3IK84_CALMI